MNNLAIIPARSGSKGIKDKNIKLLNGKPLMQYSVEAAFDSGIFKCVHVSTDSTEYARIAKRYNADIPFLRSSEYSSDSADSWSVVRFVINQYRKLGQYFDMVTLLQPTSPLRNASDIQNAYSLFLEKKADSVISVSKEEHSPLLTNTLDKTLSLNGFLDLSTIGRRQDMKEYYRVNGAIYMIKMCVLDTISDLYGEKSYAYIMPRERAVDIDNMLDFQIAEFFLER